MRITQREGGDFAFDVGAIAYASDIHFAREAGRDALHRGCGQGTCQPMQWRLFFGISRKLQIAIGLTDVDALRNGYGQLAFRPFDRDLIADGDFHAFRQWDEFVSYSRPKFTCCPSANCFVRKWGSQSWLPPAFSRRAFSRRPWAERAA